MEIAIGLCKAKEMSQEIPCVCGQSLHLTLTVMSKCSEQPLPIHKTLVTLKLSCIPLFILFLTQGFQNLILQRKT